MPGEHRLHVHSGVQGFGSEGIGGFRDLGVQGFRIKGVGSGHDFPRLKLNAAR